MVILEMQVEPHISVWPCPANLVTGAPVLLSKLWRSKQQSVLLFQEISSLFWGDTSHTAYFPEMP